MKQKILERLRCDKKFRKKMILFAGILLLLLLACLYTLVIRPARSRENYVYKEEAVNRGDLVLGIMESGSLSFTEKEVAYDLDLSLIYDDDESDSDDDEEDDDEDADKYLEISQVYVVSGQQVEEGDALFSLTESSVAAVRRKISAALAEAEISLSTAQTEYETSLISAKSTYDSSVKKGNRASEEYQAATSQGSARITGIEGEIELLTLEITQAQEALADEDFLESISEAQIAYTSAKNKYEDTDVHNTTAYISNLNAYEQARETLDQLLTQKETYENTITDNQTEIEKKQKELQAAQTDKVLDDQQAKNDYNSAVLSGELAQDIYDYSTESLQDTVTQAQSTCDELQQLLDDFDAFAGEDGTVYAPEDGLLISVNCEEEDELTAESTLISYTTRDDTVSIDVSEEDIASISVGSSVELVFTAYPEETYEGTVLSITTTAASDYAATISYPVLIRVEGDTGKLYGGMTADVTFVTDSVEDVLYVSRKAVFEEDGKTCVYRKTESGGMETVEVETGFTDMSHVEIKSGLSEGDTVYLKSLMTAGSEEFTGKEEAAGGMESMEDQNIGGKGGTGKE